MTMTTCNRARWTRFGAAFCCMLVATSGCGDSQHAPPQADARDVVVQDEPVEDTSVETEAFVVQEPPQQPTSDTAIVGETRLVYSHVGVQVRGANVTTSVSDVIVNDTESEVTFRYDFPLPNDATITHFAHWVDGRRVEAVAKDTAAARGDFEKAAAEGKAASLSESRGTSRFSIELTPLAPGATRRVQLQYVQSVERFGPIRSYSFPAAHWERRGEPILDFEVDVRADTEVSALESPNHPDARAVRLSPNHSRVLLQRTATPLGDDLTIRWKERTEPLQLSARVAPAPEGEPGYGEVLFSFNEDDAGALRPARDFIFVVDTSLSMAGDALNQARTLVERASAHLTERDRTALITFDDELTSWDSLLEATPQIRSKLVDDVRNHRAAGLSNVEAAIDRAAELVRQATNPVVVFVTDGQSTVGSEMDALQPASGAADFEAARVTVALVNYPSRQPLFERLFPAASVRFVPSGEAGKQLVQDLAQLVAAPVIEDLTMEIDGLLEDRRHGNVTKQLALGEQVRVLGRLHATTLHAKVTGTLHGQPVAFETMAQLGKKSDESSTVPLQWARARIASLELAESSTHDPALRTEAIALAKSFGLVSSFTSLVARDSLSPDRVAPGDPEIRIRAPQSDSEVYAMLPWGERVDCGWLPSEGVWYGRFLVPRTVSDGLYRARVYTTSQGRTTLRGSLAFAVDSRPPQFDLELERRKSGLELRATPRRDVFDVHGDVIRLDLVDVKRVTVRLGNKTFELDRADESQTHWSTEIALDQVRELLKTSDQLTLVATDYAQNSAQSFARLSLTTDGQAKLTMLETTPDPKARVELLRTAPTSVSPAKVSFNGFGTPANCRFGYSSQRAAITTGWGATVELFDELVRIDGKELTPCRGLPEPHPTAISPFEGGFVIGFRSGSVYAWRSETQTWRRLVALDGTSVTALSWAESGTLWIGTMSRGIWRIDDSEVTQATLAGLKNERITALALDGKVLHVGTNPRGVWRVDTETLRATRRSSVSAGCFAQRGNEVVALAAGAACQGGSTVGRVPSSHVTALSKWKNRLIVGTFDRGVYSLGADGSLEPISDAPRYINAMAVSGEDVWLATPIGLFRYRDGKTTAVPTPTDTRHVNGLTVASDGTVWLATGNGVAGWRNGHWVVRAVEGLPSRLTYAIAEATDGSLWVGTAAGAVRLSQDGHRIFSIESGSLPHRWVTALLPRDNAMLVGTYSGGVTKLAGATSTPEVDALWINPHGLFREGDQIFAATLGDGLWSWAETGPAKRARIGGLPSDDVTAVAEFAGRLWVGTRGGLADLPLGPTTSPIRGDSIVAEALSR